MTPPNPSLPKAKKNPLIVNEETLLRNTEWGVHTSSLSVFLQMVNYIVHGNEVWAGSKQHNKQGQHCG